MHRISLSFFAVFIGWAVAYAAQIHHQVNGPGFGYITDFGFWLVWPAIFTFVGWLLFLAPSVNVVSKKLPPMRPVVALPLSLICGAAIGAIIYGILVCTWVPGASQLIWYPMTVGAVAIPITTALLRMPVQGARRKWMTVLGMLLPPVGCVVFAFVVWPLTIRFSPYFAYVYGAGESRGLAHAETLKQVHLGDSFASLHERYPKLFDEPFLSGSGTASSKLSYEISFDEPGGKISVIKLTEKP